MGLYLCDQHGLSGTVLLCPHAFKTFEHFKVSQPHKLGASGPQDPMILQWRRDKLDFARKLVCNKCNERWAAIEEHITALINETIEELPEQDVLSKELVPACHQCIAQWMDRLADTMA